MINMASEDLDKLKGDRKLPRKILFKRTWQYVKKEWVSFLFAFLLVFVGVAIDIVFPLFMQHLTNTLQNPTDQTLKIILMIAIGQVVLDIRTRSGKPGRDFYTRKYQAGLPDVLRLPFSA